jgi:hypothetical protein
MKFRTGLIIGAAIGYVVATRLRRDESTDDSQTGLASLIRVPATDRLAERRRRLADLAAARSAAAIRRTRFDLRRRLEASAED